MLAREYTSGFIESPLFVLAVLELAEKYGKKIFNTRYARLDIHLGT